MMTKQKLEDLQKQGQAAVAKAKSIAENAENAGRKMSVGEQAAQIKSAKADLAVVDKVRQIGDAIGQGLDGTSGSS